MALHTGRGNAFRAAKSNAIANQICLLFQYSKYPTDYYVDFCRAVAMPHTVYKSGEAIRV